MEQEVAYVRRYLSIGGVCVMFWWGFAAGIIIGLVIGFVLIGLLFHGLGEGSGE